MVYCNYNNIATNKLFFNETTSVLFVKQEVHKIDYKYTVNLFLLKVLLVYTTKLNSCVKLLMNKKTH